MGTSDRSATKETILSLRPNRLGGCYNKVNKGMVKEIRQPAAGKPEKKDSDAKNELQNRGKLIIEATCAPADIPYPTDLGLLNGAQVYTTKILYILYKFLKNQVKKQPITYRNLA